MQIESMERGLRVLTTTPWAEVADGLQRDPGLRGQLSASIADSPFPAVFWECVPVSRATRDRPFEYVVLDSPSLARMREDPGPFADHLRPGASAFDNLGRDARLVAPGPGAQRAHLAAFLRTGHADCDALWARVGAEVEAWWARTDAPVWVSTSGLGVGWVHVRLDTRPKYVTHRPYRVPPQAGVDRWR